MQAIYKDEDERKSSKIINSINTIVYTIGPSRYMEEEYLRRFGSKSFRI